MDRLLKALDWLNLLDAERKLSLTNLGLICLLARVIASPTLDWASVTTLALAFANYAHKRSESAKAISADDNEQMQQVKAQYEAAVKAQADAILQINEKIQKVTDAVKIFDLTKLKMPGR